MSLSNPIYQSLYKAVQVQVRTIPDQILRSQPERLGIFLDRVLMQQPFFNPEPGSPTEQAVLDWLDIVESLTSRLNSLYLRHASRAVERWHMAPNQTVAAAAQQFLVKLEEDPAHQLIALADNITPRRIRTAEDDEINDYRSYLIRLDKIQQKFAKQITRELSVFRSAETLVRFHGFQREKSLCHVIHVLIKADTTYALALYQELLQTILRDMMLRCLSLFYNDMPFFVEDFVSRILVSENEKDIAAILNTTLDIAWRKQGQFELTILSLARSPYATVRAELARTIFIEKDNQLFAINSLLVAGNIDDSVGRAIFDSLKALSYELSISKETTKLLLSETVHLPLEKFFRSDEGFQRIAKDLVNQEPFWLIEHLEQRLGLGQGQTHQDSEAFAALFGKMTETAAVTNFTPKLYHKLWSVYLQYNHRSSKYSVGVIFRRIAQIYPIEAEIFIRQVVFDVDATVEIIQALLSLVFTLPESIAGQVVDDIVIRSEQLSASMDELETIRDGVINDRLSPIKSKFGRGPFPRDTRLKELAEQRIAAAHQRQLIGEPLGTVLVDFWSPILTDANSNIQRVLEREDEEFGPST